MHANSRPPSTPGDLLDTLAAWREAREADAAVTGLPRASEWPGLPALATFDSLTANLRQREHMRRALAPAPADAGPLNSRALVSRTLQLMHAQSPGYLRHFTAYVDALAALQALQQASASATDAGHGSAGTKPARKRARPRPARKAVRPPPRGPDAG